MKTTAIIALLIAVKPGNASDLDSVPCFKGLSDQERAELLHKRLHDAYEAKGLLQPDRLTEGTQLAGDIWDCLMAFEVSDVYVGQNVVTEVFNDKALSNLIPFTIVFDVAVLGPGAEKFRLQNMAEHSHMDGITFAELLSMFRTRHERAAGRTNQPPHP